MSYTWQDAAFRLSGNEQGQSVETFATEIAGMPSITFDEVKKIFPDITLSKSESVAYLPVKMAHSLPAVNQRRRCFTPQTLANSFASAKHSLVDLDHMLVDNGVGHRDVIIGHVVSAVFDPEGKTTHEIASKNYLPSEPAPMLALVALFMRHQAVPGIIKQHETGSRKWSVSMECGHLWSESCLMYRNEFIPFTEAEGGMLECISPSNIRPYRGHEIAAVIGGLNGFVDFWGLGMTQNPADAKGDVLAIFGGRPRELASRKIFYMPLRAKKFPSLEAANTGVDSNIKEMANVTVIGTTDKALGPQEDDHVHEVLSDGTILPAHNHAHYLASYNLVLGTKPKLTGRTDTHYLNPNPGDGYGNGIIHMHLLDLPLNKKPGKDSEKANDATSPILEFDMTVDEFFKKFEEKLSTGKLNDKEDQASLLREVASMKNVLAEQAKKEEIKTAVEVEIASRIEKKELVKKEDLDRAVAEKETSLKAAYAKEKADADKRAERLEKVKGLGINPDHVIDDADKVTIKGMIDEIGVDEAGDKTFNRQYKILEKMANDAKAAAAIVPANDPLNTDDEDEDEVDQTDHARSLANADKKSAKTQDKTPFLLVGSPTNTGREREVASTNEKKQGRHIFSKKS